MIKGIYILVSNRLSPEVSDKITKAIEAKFPNVGWWHWYQDAWVLKDPSARGCESWRDAVKEVAPEAQFYVFEMTGDFAGWSSESHHEWLQKHL